MSGVRVIHEPTGIIVRSTHRRSQKQNLLQAFETLEEKIEEHFFVPKARRKTKPTKSAKIKRQESKKHRSHIKKHRSKASWE
jgi:ribosome-associated protein